MDEKKKIFEEIANEYDMLLLNWAYKKLGDREKAEDLAQEVFLQMYTTIEKGDSEIAKIDNFVWKIAHYTWCNYLRKNKKYKMCIQLDEYAGGEAEDFAESLVNGQECMDFIKKIRTRISRLSYLKRDIMISFYLEGMSVQEIAAKHAITEANVKWHLYSTRQRIKEEIVMEQNEYVYRPKRLNVGVSGETVAELDVFYINNSLLKQNICMLCYKEAKSKEDLVQMLGVPMAYIEEEVSWLEEKEFLYQDKNRYVTMFTIEPPEQKEDIFNIYYKRKKSLLDFIIDSIISNEDKIREIGFYGNDVDIKKLLWLLLYQYSNYQRYPVRVERPVRQDGGRYFPLGFEMIQDKQQCGKLKDWSCNGPMSSWNFMWFGTYNFGHSDIEKLIDAYDVGWLELQKMLKTIIYEDVDISSLNTNEKSLCSELVQKGFVRMEGNKLYPNFYIFTPKQYEQLKEIFKSISEKLDDEIHALKEEFTDYFRGKIPTHLRHYQDVFIAMAYGDLVLALTVSAFRDGKLYQPKDSSDGEFLTMMYVKE